jgi:hypothetical protein
MGNFTACSIGELRTAFLREQPPGNGNWDLLRLSNISRVGCCIPTRPTIAAAVVAASLGPRIGRASLPKGDTSTRDSASPGDDPSHVDLVFLSRPRNDGQPNQRATGACWHHPGPQVKRRRTLSSEPCDEQLPGEPFGRGLVLANGTPRLARLEAVGGGGGHPWSPRAAMDHPSPFLY